MWRPRKCQLFLGTRRAICVIIVGTSDGAVIVSNFRPGYQWQVDVGIFASYDCVMTQPPDSDGLPSPSSALLQLARLKSGMSQRELAGRAGVPVTMISAYERDQRQPTLTTLLRLIHAAGFDLRLHLAAYDPHDDILAGLEAGRSESERLHRDRQLQAWRQATSAEDVA
jgi:transcriptional regulator with XRE-family HTH domain